MAITKVNGTKGAKGTNGPSPTDGENGTDAIFTQNGKLGADTLTIQANGGDGGAGGKGTGQAGGANGGKGGNAAITLNGNIFNAPATANLKVSGSATGGDGGPGGASVNAMPGDPGNGGNATVAMNGNIVNPSKTMNTVELDAVAVGGNGTRYGNATATINGNIIQPQKANQVTLKAVAQSAGPDDVSHDGDLHYGVKTATVNGNIVQGNVNNVWLSADAYPSNGTANLNGNIVQTNPANTGIVTLEASGNTIAVTNNKLHLGKQELDLSIGSYNPYNVTIANNEFAGTGGNSFVFTDAHVPGSYFDTVSANLAAGTFVFDGQNNVLSNFLNIAVSGDVTATLVGSDGANALTGGNGDDTLTGGKGNDTLDGGAGSDTAIYQGLRSQYTLAFSHVGDLAGTVTDNVAGRDGADTLKNIELLRFSDGTYDVVNDVFVSNNHAPVATDDAYATNEDTPLTIAAPGVLGNDTDVENDPLTSTVVTGPAHGTLTLNADGSFTYTPNANYNGADSFTYKANDGTADSNVATATITINPVNDAPVAADDSYSTDFETALTVPGPGLLGNDTDVDGDPLHIGGLVTGPAHGSLVLNTDGSFTYTPDAGYSGTDSFTYKANDGTTDSNIATATIAVSNGQIFAGTPGNDILTGTNGDDIFYATTGNDTMDGGGNTAIGDTVVFTNATGGVNVVINTAQDFTASGLGTLSMTNMENLTGSNFDDILTGDAGRNTLNGGDGDDVLVATAGGDTLIGGANGPAGDTADFSHGTMGVVVDLTQTGPQLVSAEFGAMTIVGIENVIGTDFNDVITGDAGNNFIDGGAGIDTVLFSTQPAAADVGWNGSAFTVTGPDGTDTLRNVEILDDAGAGSRILLVGGGGYATINAAIAAAHAGDTILIAPGTYNENVVVNKRLNIAGVGPAGSVVIHGTFADHNGIVGPVNEFLRTHAYDVTGVGDGITVSANNVSLSNLTVEDFNNAVAVSGAGVSGLKLTGVTMQHSVNGFAKPDGTALSGLTIDGSTFNDDYIGAYFYNDDFAQAAASDATNTKIINSSFQDLTQKGIYAETLQGNTLFDNLTMDNVGQYGGGTAFGAQGKNGAGIDVNLKFNTYTGNLTISDFHFTDVGASTGVDPTGDANAAAIAIKGRDDPSYAAHPADVSGLNVAVKDGTIDGTSTGIRAGENKANPADNVTGPAMTVSNVDITGNLSNGKHDQIDNRTHSLMTVNGTSGDDIYHAATTAASTGPIHLIGLGGNDSLWGGNGDDVIEGGGGNDILRGAGGNDTIDGGSGTDVAYYSGNEWQYTTVSLTHVVGLDGDDTLTNVERLKFLAPDHVSDLNNDGFGDLVYQRATDGKVQFISSDGTAAAGLTAVSGSFGANWKAIQTGVFNSNANRNASLLLQDTTTGNLEIWKAGANSNSTGLSAAPGLGWNAIATGDFDGDGASDVLLQNGPGGQAEIMFLAGNAQTSGTVTGTAAVSTPAGWNVVGSGDFNGDGKSDILWQDPASAAHDVQISLMDGANTTASATITGPGAGYTAIGTGDFNGDGKSDILFGDAAGNALVWTMDGAAHVGTASFAKPTGNGWSLRGATDYNRDGVSDLIWQKGATTDVQLVNPNLTAGSLLTLTNAPGAAFGLVASTGGG